MINDEINTSISQTPLEKPAKRKKHKLLFAIIFLLLLSVLILYFHKQQKAKNENTNVMLKEGQLSNTKETEDTLYNAIQLEKKSRLISSTNIDEVMAALSLGHIPEENFDNKSFSDVYTDAFKMFLSDEDDFNKLYNHFNASKISIFILDQIVVNINNFTFIISCFYIGFA